MNARLLKAEMVKHDCNVARLATEIGISEESVRRKLRGESKFDVEEASRISQLLNIKNPNEIFF